MRTATTKTATKATSAACISVCDRLVIEVAFRWKARLHADVTFKRVGHCSLADGIFVCGSSDDAPLAHNFAESRLIFGEHLANLEWIGIALHDVAIGGEKSINQGVPTRNDVFIGKHVQECTTCC